MDAHPVRIAVLGPIRVQAPDGPPFDAGRQQGAVVASLAIRSGWTASVSEIAATIWGADPPPTARTRIQTHISTLRKLIGQEPGDPDGAIATAAGGYRLRTGRVDLDLDMFEAACRRAAAAAAEGRWPAAAADFDSALRTWRGAAYEDLDYPLIQAAAQALDERRLFAVEGRATAYLALERAGEVVGELRQALAEHPCRERLMLLLMLAFWRLGCRDEALAVYRSGRSNLIAALGIEPGPDVQGLHGAVLRGRMDEVAPLPGLPGGWWT